MRLDSVRLDSVRLDSVRLDSVPAGFVPVPGAGVTDFRSSAPVSGGRHHDRAQVTDASETGSAGTPADAGEHPIPLPLPAPVNPAGPGATTAAHGGAPGGRDFTDGRCPAIGRTAALTPCCPGAVLMLGVTPATAPRPGARPD